MMDNEWVLKIADFGYATLLAGKRGDGKLTTFLGTLSYASPEILSKQPYLGSCADIFSAGVILFVLVTGKLPYGKAVASDSFYKNFVNNDYEGFWQMIAPKIGKVSENFKSLVSLMLSYDPSQRPSINEIKNHAWFIDKCPSKESMQKEFEKRKIIVSEQRQIEAKKKEDDKNNKKRNRVVRTGAYKGKKGDVEVDIDLDLKLEDDKERTLMRFVDTGNPYNVKVKETDPETLFSNLYKYLLENKRNKEIVINKKNYAFKIIYNENEEMQKDLEGIEYDKLELKIVLNRQDDENMIIEFIRLKGDKMEFYEIYEEFASFKEI